MNRRNKTFRPWAERFESRSLASTGLVVDHAVFRPDAHETRPERIDDRRPPQLRGAANLVTYAVITLNNQTSGLVRFTVAIPPNFPNHVAFQLQPNGAQAYFSYFRPGQSPQFKITYSTTQQQGRNMVTNTLTQYNTYQAPADFDPTPNQGFQYSFIRTSQGVTIV